MLAPTRVKREPEACGHFAEIGVPWVDGFLFVPGLHTTTKEQEEVYATLCQRSATEVGCAPMPARIFNVSCRLEGRDCEIEVGRDDPITGAEVLAILSHGRHHPFVVHTACADAGPALHRVPQPVYSVTEFS